MFDKILQFLLHTFNEFGYTFMCKYMSQNITYYLMILETVSIKTKT